MGGIAYGTPGFVAANRTSDDYSIGRDTTQATSARWTSFSRE